MYSPLQVYHFIFIYSAYRHVCLCHVCANTLRLQSEKCPFCRSYISELIYLSMNQNEKKDDSAEHVEIELQEVQNKNQCLCSLHPFHKSLFLLVVFFNFQFLQSNCGFFYSFQFLNLSVFCNLYTKYKLIIHPRR